MTVAISMALYATIAIVAHENEVLDNLEVLWWNLMLWKLDVLEVCVVRMAASTMSSYFLLSLMIADMAVHNAAPTCRWKQVCRQVYCWNAPAGG